MTVDFLPFFPQPLLDDIIRNRCLPIVGAGFSLNADIPVGRKIPVWGELADELGKELPDYPKSSPIDVISAYSHEFGRSKLIERLGSLLLISEAKVGETHQAFAQCHFDMVVTTNFDFLLERAYEKAGKICNPVIEEEQLAINGEEAHVTLLKFHGDLRHPTRLVATESDYDTFLDRYPLLSTFLASLLIVRTPLLVGYSLEDPDFRHIWQLIGDRLGQLRRTAYVLSVGAKQSDVARYDRRGVKVINLPGSKADYPEILAQVFSQLRDYWSRNLPSVSKVMEDETLADLSLPPDATSRLCYFAVSSSMVSFYRNEIFPLAKEAGLTPVTVEDLISPSDSVTAKISALLARAEVVIAEDQSKWVLHELRRLPNKVRILLVRTGTHATGEDVSSTWHILKRPRDRYWESTEFVAAIGKWLESVSQELQPQLLQEPARLLKKAEYRPAVISAIGLLEMYLREHIAVYLYEGGKNVRTLQGGYSSLRYLLDMATKMGLLPQTALGDIHSWVHIRNRVVHMGDVVSKHQATRIVRGIERLLADLKEGQAQTAAHSDSEPLDDLDVPV